MLLALLIYSKYVTLMVKFKQDFCTVLNSYCFIKNHHEHLLPTISTDLSHIFQRLLAILLWLVKPTPYWSTYVFRSLLSPKNASVKTVHIHLWDLIPQYLKKCILWSGTSWQKRSYLFYILTDTAKRDHHFKWRQINFNGVSHQWFCLPCAHVGNQLWMKGFAVKW